MVLGRATTLPKFNPTNDPRVDTIKGNVENLIKYMETLTETDGVDGRCASLAITNFEQGAMWAVKSLFVK